MRPAAAGFEHRGRPRRHPPGVCADGPPGELREARGRLDALDGGDLAANVRAVFFWSEAPEGVVMVRVEPLIEVMVPTVPGPSAMPKGPPRAPPAPGAAPGPPGVPTELAAVWAVAA